MNTARYTFAKSRSGETVPCCPLPLHSMIDPKREALRLVSQVNNAGFLIFLGLGGGFAPQAALEKTNAHVVVIDYNKESIAELMTGIDYSKLLADSRFSLLIDPDGDEIKKIILEQYKPALCGGIKTIPLRARTELDKAVFENAAEKIQEAIEIVIGDYSVQAHFGFRWFSNIIRNIKQLKTREQSVLCSEFLSFKPKEIAIVAAGPSLDMQINSLAEFKSRGGFVISSDTALNSVSHNGIEADAVVSIDCQHIGCYHFMENNLRNIPLILDIASPPLLYNLTPSAVFFSSGHPLARYICAHWRPFMQLDTSGANVTYACLSLAEALGPDRITLFGADFSYHKSQSYARGTYIYPFFSKKQNRIFPLEAQLSAFLYRSPFLQSEDMEKKDYYETARLRFYRNKLEEKASMMRAKISIEPGRGAPVKLTKNSFQGLYPHEFSFADMPELKNNDRSVSGADFLEQYRDSIAALPVLADNDNYQKRLNEKESNVFTTLLPLAAAMKKRNMELEKKDLIEEAKKFCIKEIDRLLT